jgi:hypothetical protein
MQRLRFLPLAWAAFILATHDALYINHRFEASVGILVGATLGECARRWPSTRWLYAAVATAIAMLAWQLQGAWFGVQSLNEHVPPLLIALVLLPALHRHRAPAFAGGAALVSTFAWHPLTPTLLYGFLFMRDIGKTPTTPSRAHFTLAMMAILAVRFGHIVATDLSYAYTAVDPPARGWFCDGPWTFVPRVLLELSVLVAARAHIQGRTWSIALLALTAPALQLLVTHTQMPMSCFGDCCFGHPLGGSNTPFIILFALAITPWLPPIVRACRQGSL